jgi:primosomal protein N' (replication factor Y) (superfamily II helicase)
MPNPHASSGRSPSGHRRVGVLLPLPLTGPYDYAVPEDMELAPGDFVSVPLGARERIGVVWGEGAGGVAETKLKEVTARIDTLPLPDVSRAFVDWVARYTVSAPGAVLRMTMSVPGALEPPKSMIGYALDAHAPEVRFTAARRRVINLLAEGPPMIAADLAREAGVGVSVIKGLAEAGVLNRVELPPAPLLVEPDWQMQGPDLSPEQLTAAVELRSRIVDDGFSVTLLDGVPGSGKTEVYFEAVAEALAKGHQVLVLLPEIALTAQWLARFRDRFGAAPAYWHSELTGAKRRATWRAVISGEAKVIVGARSALFLPFADLGLIVIDEEHDVAFKQEEGVVYNARDMAVVRGRLGGIPVIPVSATPSLETLTNVIDGRYSGLHLPARHAGASMPDIDVVDMRKAEQPSGQWISPPLQKALKETLEAGGQALLFLNRRGYAPLTLCRTCGHRMQCPRCTAWLVEHRFSTGRGRRLQCHHCGFHMAAPKACPACEAEESFVACGPGVERLAEEVEALFPEARRTVAASDTLTGPGAAEELVRQIEDHEVDIIIGTQIIAKGYHFPLLTLVGVVDADIGLTGGDLRAAERTYQLLYQVAGRAGRASAPGTVVVQTFSPDHPVMKALVSGTRDQFIAAESDARKAAGMPPFGRLVALILSDRDEARVDELSRDLARAVPRASEIQVLGPAPAPLALLRGRHRRRFLVMAGRGVNVQGFVRQWLAGVKVSGGSRVTVDVDPYGFL